MNKPVTMRTGPLGSTIHVLRGDAETVAALAAVDWNRHFRQVCLDPVRGLITLMAPSNRHEDLTSVFDDLVEAAGLILAGSARKLRSPRLRGPDEPPGTGMEPDCAFYVVSARKPPLLHEICDEPPHIRRGVGHGTHRTGTTERRLASNRPAFPASGHRRPFPSRCAERGGRNPQEMAALRQRGVFDVVRPHACAVAQADRCGAGWRPVSTMQRCVQTHRRRGSAPDRDRDAQGC